jgi:integrase
VTDLLNDAGSGGIPSRSRAGVLGKITAAQVRKMATASRHYSVRDGLLLTITRPGHGSWSVRFMRAGKSNEIGFNAPYPETGLVEARYLAAEVRRKLRGGEDPLAERAAARVAARREVAHSVTFSAAAAQYMSAHAAGWSDPRAAKTWQNSLDRYAAPVIGKLPVGEVTTEHVLQIIQPIWTAKLETASRLRGRMELILSYAVTRGWRETGLNPALWRGHLQLALPSVRQLRKGQPVQHHAALPWKELPTFMTALSGQTGIGAAALRFAILTAARSGEVRGAVWAEIDMENALWAIPATRMKANRAHRVPLSDPALAILRQMAELQHDQSDLAFPGQALGRPLSDMTMTACLRRMGKGELTAHGFRATFSMWVSEATNFAPHIAEAALAHVNGDRVAAAYMRSDLFDIRRELLRDWGSFCSSMPRQRLSATLFLPFGPRRERSGVGVWCHGFVYSAYRSWLKWRQYDGSYGRTRFSRSSRRAIVVCQRWDWVTTHLAMNHHHDFEPFGRRWQLPREWQRAAGSGRRATPRQWRIVPAGTIARSRAVR